MNVKIDISNKIIKTERLTLRAWNENDLDDFFEYASIEGVGESAGWSHHENKDISKKILNDFINNKNDFAIVYNNKVIGSLGILNYDISIYSEFNHLKGMELGYVLSKDYWGHGLMPEAVSAVIKYLFDEVGLDFITCGCFVENAKSSRVQEKCGFEFYTSSPYTTISGEVKNCFRTILTKENIF